MRIRHNKFTSLFIGLIILGIAGISIAVPNSTEGLKVSNSSKSNLFFKINNICYRDNIKINHHSIEIIPREKINNSCQASPTRCRVDIYLDKSCRNNLIVTLTIDTTRQGIISVIPYYDDYIPGASGFNLFIKGPWV